MSAKAMLAVREFTVSDSLAWDQFVIGSPQATFFHRIGWHGIFKNIFRLEPHYLLAERDGQFVGVLPLVYPRSLLFGNALIAAPFCVQGGPVALDHEADAALSVAALRLLAQIGAPA